MMAVTTDGAFINTGEFPLPIGAYTTVQKPCMVN